MANLPSTGDASQAAWRKLGSMTFDSNERSSFKARELKSVHVEAGSQLLRVVFHKPHANRLNTHCQVSYIVTPPWGRCRILLWLSGRTEGGGSWVCIQPSTSGRQQFLRIHPSLAPTKATKQQRVDYTASLGRTCWWQTGTFAGGLGGFQSAR